MSVYAGSFAGNEVETILSQILVYHVTARVLFSNYSVLSVTIIQIWTTWSLEKPNYLVLGVSGKPRDEFDHILPIYYEKWIFG